MALYVIRPPNPAPGVDWLAAVPGEYLYNVTGVTARLASATPAPSLIDVSGNAHHGGYVAAGGYPQFVAGLVAGDRAVQFGPTAGPWAGAYGQVGDTLIDWSGNFSVELWYFFDAANGFINTLFGFGAIPGTDFSSLETSQGAFSGLIWRQDLGGVTVNNISVANATPYTNVARHVVVTKTAGVIKFYVDGAAVALGTAHVLAADPANSPIVYVGRGTQVPTGATGTLDEWAVYDHALTAGRVAAHHAAAGVSFAAYTAAVLADSPGAFYHLDDTAGNTGRQVCLEITDGNVPVALVPTGFPVLTAGGPWLYSWQPGVQSNAETPAAGTFTVAIPDLIIPAGYTIGTRTLDLLAGDQWSDIAIWWDSNIMDARAAQSAYLFPPPVHLVYHQEQPS